ncbi:MAG: DNA replication/repair protein RecF [Hormoscilla sp.]
MYLKKLHLRHFRNYRDQLVGFDAAKIILVGDNAQGKSNLLEAVELLSTLRSHRTSRDRDLIWQSQARGTQSTSGQITGSLERQTGSVDLKLILRSNGRRTVALNDESLRRQMDFLGVLNVVKFSSLDLELVRGSPERRRTMLDSLLTQLEPVYAHFLGQYNQVLRQRNKLLKKIQSEPEFERPEELAVWDAQLVTIGARLMRRRARVIERLAPIAVAWHSDISGSQEVLKVQYAPNVEWPGDSRSPPAEVQQAFLEKIQQRAMAEKYQGTSLVGPHRDEVELIVDDTPARQYASQGQQRTLVLALKLAELKLIWEVVGESPLLLLDDVLAELDLNRQNQLLEAIGDRFQTLIATTHLGAFDGAWLQNSQILLVQAGQIQPLMSV